MIDAFAYTSERVAPVTGPRAPQDRKPKGGKARRKGGAVSGTLPPGLKPRGGPLVPGSAIIVSRSILDELRAIAPPMVNPRPFDPARGIADPYFTGYPIVSSGIIA